MGSVTFVDTSGWLYMLFRQNRNSNHNSALYITSSNFWLSSSYHHEGYFMPFNIKLWQCKNNFIICLITGYILASFPIGKIWKSKLSMTTESLSRHWVGYNSIIFSKFEQNNNYCFGRIARKNNFTKNSFYLVWQETFHCHKCYHNL